MMTFAALRVAYHLHSNEGREQFIPAEVCAREDLPALHQEFSSHGLIIDERRSAGVPSFQLRSAAQPRIRTLASEYRQAAIQLAILEGIEEHEDSGSIEDYFPPIGVLGLPIEKREYDRAVQQLMDWEMLKGIALGQADLVRPMLTSSGFQAFQSGLSPQLWAEGQTQCSSVTANYGDTKSQVSIFHGPVGVFQQGDHNQATGTQTLGFDAEGFGSVRAQIREVLQSSDIDVDVREAAEVQLDLIQQQAESGATRGKVKAFMGMFMAALPPLLAGEIVDLAGHAVSMIQP